MPEAALRPFVFATRNAGKVSEVKALLGSDVPLLSLDDIGCADELPETGHTLEANARQKAAYVQERFGVDVFAEDSGLLVRALGDAPGVYSARYAGPQASDADNMALLLTRLGAEKDRAARFRTVISLHWQGEWHLFQGECRGFIGLAPSGEGGFGYDPLFYPYLQDRGDIDAEGSDLVGSGAEGGDPEGSDATARDPAAKTQEAGLLSDRTFAQMSRAEKNAISHRGQAVRALVHFLRSRISGLSGLLPGRASSPASHLRALCLSVVCHLPALRRRLPPGRRPVAGGLSQGFPAHFGLSFGRLV
jgi:XTP/dITP diphosphohydrolase